MLSKLPPPWGPTVQQLLELELRCRRMATQAITKRAEKIFTSLADRYRAEADSRKKKEDARPGCIGDSLHSPFSIRRLAPLGHRPDFTPMSTAVAPRFIFWF